MAKPFYTHGNLHYFNDEHAAIAFAKAHHGSVLRTSPRLSAKSAGIWRVTCH